MSASVRVPFNCSPPKQMLAAAVQTGGFVSLPPLSSSACLPSTYFYPLSFFSPLFSSLFSLSLLGFALKKNVFALLSSISFPLNGPPEPRSTLLLYLLLPQLFLR